MLHLVRSQADFGMFLSMITPNAPLASGCQSCTLQMRTDWDIRHVFFDYAVSACIQGPVLLTWIYFEPSMDN